MQNIGWTSRQHRRQRVDGCQRERGVSGQSAIVSSANRDGEYSASSSIAQRNDLRWVIRIYRARQHCVAEANNAQIIDTDCTVEPAQRLHGDGSNASVTGGASDRIDRDCAATVHRGIVVAERRRRIGADRNRQHRRCHRATAVCNFEREARIARTTRGYDIREDLATWVWIDARRDYIAVGERDSDSIDSSYISEVCTVAADQELQAFFGVFRIVCIGNL